MTNFPMNQIDERIIQYTQERAKEQDEINKLKLPIHYRDPKFTEKLIEESKIVDLRDSSYPSEEKV